MKNSAIMFLEETAKKYPHKIAVDDTHVQYCFEELRRISIGLSNLIAKSLNNGINKPIAVFLPKCSDCIAVFAGIHYSGNFYVPLDIKSSEDRLRKILENMKPSIIITTGKYVENCEKLGFDENNIIKIEDIDATDELGHENYKLVIDTDPAYVIYTSGSTGVPKGVTISHGSIIDYINWYVETYKINSEDNIGNQVPLYFDVSTSDFYGMAKTGAKLTIIPEKLFNLPFKLVNFLKNEKITSIFWVPFAVCNIANSDALNKLSDELYLKRVLFAGEVMPNKQLNYWRNKLPNIKYANLYGPTEITVIATYYNVNRSFYDYEPLPIGNACNNADTFILDDNNKLVTEKDVLGELCVRGTSLALGYWNNPEKTAEAFTQNPLQNNYPERIYRTGDLVYYNEYGEIMYSCRKDNQIKHMGHRIELGEIETAASSMDGIKACCAVYDKNDSKIVIFYESEEKIEMRFYRRYLLTKIPKYMIPNKFIWKQHLPINANGKIDRKLLNQEVGN